MPFLLFLLPAFVLTVGWLVYHAHTRTRGSLEESEPSGDSPRMPESVTAQFGLDRAFWTNFFCILLPALLILLVISLLVAKSNFDGSWTHKEFIPFSVIISIFILVPMVLAIPVCLVCLFFRQTRWLAMMLFAIILGYMLFLSFDGFFEHQFRMRALHQFTGRSKPLITAIRAYQNEQGVPPATLSQLVPRYLPRVPSTGIGARPEYEYLSGEKALERYPGNPWVLSVIIPFDSSEPRSITYRPNADPQSWGDAIDGWSYNGY